MQASRSGVQVGVEVEVEVEVVVVVGTRPLDRATPKYPMSDGYRDPLAAALARVEQLERENAALKNLQSGRPATAAELEIVRLENELRYLDSQWEASVRRNFGMAPTAQALKVTARISWLLPLGLVVAAIVGAAFGRPGGAHVFLGVFGGTAILTWLVMRWTMIAIQRQRAAHEERRAPMVRQIAALRGQGREAPPAARLRVGDEREVESIPAESDTGDEARGKRTA
ncbi:MAG: hypothetical protein ACLQVI_07370 [Polyangiaceae bacterium]